jgi:hypothetical protein
VQRIRAESAKVFVRLVNPPFAAIVRGTKIMLVAGLSVKKLTSGDAGRRHAP